MKNLIRTHVITYKQWCKWRCYKQLMSETVCVRAYETDQIWGLWLHQKLCVGLIYDWWQLKWKCRDCWELKFEFLVNEFYNDKDLKTNSFRNDMSKNVLKNCMLLNTVGPQYSLTANICMSLNYTCNHTNLVRQFQETQNIYLKKIFFTNHEILPYIVKCKRLSIQIDLKRKQKNSTAWFVSFSLSSWCVKMVSMKIQKINLKSLVTQRQFFNELLYSQDILETELMLSFGKSIQAAVESAVVTDIEIIRQYLCKQVISLS